MKLKYYGTAASEGTPALFCSCEVCEKARFFGGRNVRTRSQAIINDDLLLDFPADTYLHVLNYGLDLRKVKACLITHSHDDHCYGLDMLYRMPTYSHFPNGDRDKKPLDVYASGRAARDLSKLFRKEDVKEKDPNALSLHKMKFYETYDVHGYAVTPLRAKHEFGIGSVFYIIQKNGKSVLYAHDTGFFHDDAWAYIENCGIVFDFVSLDCTCTKDNNCYDYHMSLKACCDVRERLLKKNADSHTIFCLNHFSHNGGYTYDELVPIASEKGFVVSFDSMEVEF